MPSSTRLSPRAFAALLLVVAGRCLRRRRRSRPRSAAKSYIVLDLTTHQTLAERDADAPADPASLTKLMTAYVVFARCARRS